MLTLASCSPTPSEGALFNKALKSMEENKICPPNTSPLAVFTNFNGYEINSQTYPQNGLRPPFILLNEYDNDEIIKEMVYVHETYHYCSLQKEEDFQDNEIISSKYGRLMISRGYSLLFKNENGSFEQIDIFEEAFAYMKSVQLHSNPKEASEKLLYLNQSMFKVATLMNILTYNNPDIHLLSFSDFISSLTGRELNGNDLDILLSEFEQVELGLKTPEQADLDIRELLKK